MLSPQGTKVEPKGPRGEPARERVKGPPELGVTIRPGSRVIENKH